MVSNGTTTGSPWKYRCEKQMHSAVILNLLVPKTDQMRTAKALIISNIMQTIFPSINEDLIE